jgi:D-alanine-D-alanine ligase
MHVAVVYNKPVRSYYSEAGEQEAVNGVVTEVVAVRRSLRELGHSVDCVSLGLPFEAARERLARMRADLVFNLFEGFPGHPDSETEIPAALDELRIPCTGCPPAALRLGLDKAKTKQVLGKGGINTPDFQLLRPGGLASFRLGLPCIVKPNSEDASHGVTEESVVRDLPSLEKQLKKVFNNYGGEEALVEEFVDGREFNATVMGNGRGQVLAISEIAFSLPAGVPRIITFAGKWEPESIYYRGTEVVCPARIAEDERRKIAGAAEAAFRLTGCRGYARVDMRMDDNGRLSVIEKQAAASGLDYTRFIEKIVALAMER